MDERLEAPEYLSRLRRLYQPDKGGRCPQCGPGEGRWPCTVAALLEHIDAQDAELARLRAQVTAKLRMAQLERLLQACRETIGFDGVCPICCFVDESHEPDCPLVPLLTDEVQE